MCKPMIDKIREEIIATNYCDMKALDFSCSFFGDEVYICVEKDESTSWKISFIMCANVKYETDAAWSDTWRKNPSKVRDMRSPQLGYYCQEIDVTENSELNGFYDVHFDLSIMTGDLTCKEIVVEEIPKEQINKFWESN